MIDYRFQGRLSYIPGGALNVNMSAWPAVGGGFDKTGLISWWSMDETSGTRNDSHGTNHLTDVNTTGYGTGKISNGADFDSASLEHLYLADNASISTGDIDFTVAAWVNFESLAPNPGVRVIAGQWDTNAAYKRSWALWHWGADARLQFRISGDGVASSYINATAASSTGTWYFVVAWHDATANTINIQINNGAPDSLSYSSGAFDSSGRFSVGVTYNNNAITATADYHMNGLIDELSFWKRVLTADEKTWLYNSGNGRAYSEL